ncbi:hypothetical protein ACH4SP_22600 [Streptomyces sp. NPDC021093]|uniref:hypothetical protein n=1 Tax=Streptomyces sp. NPDC021093 TaxID=3365112 RepID=UPI0037BD2067
MEVPPSDDHNGDFLLQPPQHVSNSVSGQASGPVVQAGVIHNVTVNYQANSASLEADTPPTTGFLGARVPRTPAEVAEVRRSRPNLWEYLLYAGELRVGLEGLQSKRLDYSLGHCSIGPAIPDAAEASFHLQAAFGELEKAGTSVNRWMSQEAQDRAFGLPGSPGDPELIVHIAHRLLGVYESLMDWAIALRSMRPPGDMARLFELASLYSRGSIDGFHRFVETLASETDRASATLAKGDGSVAHITVTYTMSIDPDVIRDFNAERRQVERKPGKRARRR